MNQIQQSIQKILSGITIFLICTILAGFVNFFSTFAAVATTFTSLATGGSIVSGLSTIAIITILVNLGVLFGLIAYYRGLKSFASQLDENTASAVRKLSTGAILNIIAIIISIFEFLPLLGFAIGIGVIVMSVIAFIFNLIGYSALKNATGLNEKGRAGASQLHTGYIFAIIAVVVGLIPLIGAIPALILNILYWVYLFNGWKKIKASFAE